MPADDPDEPVTIPIRDEIDLHTFRPAEIESLLDSYFQACRQRGLSQVRVIHGKGTGTLRASVAAVLNRSPWVKSSMAGDELSGGWGATIVTLKSVNSC